MLNNFKILLPALLLSVTTVYAAKEKSADANMMQKSADAKMMNKESLEDSLTDSQKIKLDAIRERFGKLAETMQGLTVDSFVNKYGSPEQGEGKEDERTVWKDLVKGTAENGGDLFVIKVQEDAKAPEDKMKLVLGEHAISQKFFDTATKALKESKDGKAFFKYGTKSKIYVVAWNQMALGVKKGNFFAYVVFSEK